MAAITTSVALTVGSAAYQKRQQDKAQRKATRAGERADAESAEFLAKAGKAADADILQSAQNAAQKIGEGAFQAEQRLEPFAGTDAFSAAQDRVFNPEDLTGPLAQSIASGSKEAVDQFSRSIDTSGPVGQAVSREAMLGASGGIKAFDAPLLNAAQEEIATAGDISGIRRRGFGGQSDLASSTAAARASAQVGQAPQLADIISGGQERRLLSDVAQDQTNVQFLETLAGGLGRIRGGV